MSELVIVHGQAIVVIDPARANSGWECVSTVLDRSVLSAGGKALFIDLGCGSRGLVRDAPKFCGPSGQDISPGCRTNRRQQLTARESQPNRIHDLRLFCGCFARSVGSRYLRMNSFIAV